MSQSRPARPRSSSSSALRLNTDARRRCCRKYETVEALPNASAARPHQDRESPLRQVTASLYLDKIGKSEVSDRATTLPGESSEQSRPDSKPDRESCLRDQSRKRVPGEP